MVESIEKVIEEFREAYNRNPRNWHVLVGYDKQRRLNIYIGQREENSIWVILTEPHFGLGERVDDINISELVDSKITFGLRRIPNNLAEKMKKELLEYNVIKEKTMEEVKEYMIKYPPLKEKEVSGNTIVQGPLITLSPEYDIDERIRNKILSTVKEKLRKKFEGEIIKRYKYLG